MHNETTKHFPWRKLADKAIMNLGIIGPCFFIAASMGLAVLTGGTFTIGTHMLAYWEAIVYSVIGIALTIYAFISINLNQE